MLEISGLNKRYANGVQALRGIDLSLGPGMFGLLGPNGAGKSTLMKILATLLRPDTGAVRFDDVDLIKDQMAIRRVLGYLPQEFGFYPTFTARQVLNYLARLKGVSHRTERKALVATLLEKVNLASVSDQRVGGFSGGMRQRLGIAQALIGEPRLLIVDEPTAGLDPEERARFYGLLSELAGKDTVVILSTHIVADVSALCGRFAIIRQGQIVSATTPSDALAGISGSVWEADVPTEQLSAYRGRFEILSSQTVDGRAKVRVFSGSARPAEEFGPSTPTLEDYYVIAKKRREGCE